MKLSKLIQLMILLSSRMLIKWIDIDQIKLKHRRHDKGMISHLEEMKSIYSCNIITLFLSQSIDWNDWIDRAKEYLSTNFIYVSLKLPLLSRISYCHLLCKGLLVLFLAEMTKVDFEINARWDFVEGSRGQPWMLRSI